MVPPGMPDFLTRRLMLAASKRLTKRLEREWYRQLEQLRLSDLDVEAEEDEE